MFAVYATHAAPDDPLSALRIGDLPEPEVPDGWVRVKISHASLNRHDLFTLQGISGHPEGVSFPIILGNDAAGTLDDGTPVVIYPMMGSDDWRGDETLDPQWHIPSEFIHGTFADYAVVPRRNAIRLPQSLSLLHASVLGTAWLTAYRALFTKSGLRAGDTVLIQGATGGMATALIQLGRAAGFEIWVTSRSEEGQALARSLGAHRTFASDSPLPRKVPAVIDSIGAASWAHSLSSLARGGTLVAVGGTTGLEVPLNLLPVIASQLTITGSIMGTLEDMQNMLRLIATAGIEPEIGVVLPMERAEEGFRAMWEGHTCGKTVFTRHASMAGSHGISPADPQAGS
jgi:NADPH:quinone reductase-like Zn-dependent oxidoreductase